VINVGVIGLGFMGQTHYRAYKALDSARVVAAADTVAKRLAGDWSDASGNIGDAAGSHEDLSTVKTYTKMDDLLADDDVQLVDVTLPTFLHEEAVVKAAEAGKHVFCEKPMALTVEASDRMAEAAEKAGVVLMIGQCLRFWPEYEVAKSIVDSGRYGRALAAEFRRLSPLPGWSGWLTDHKKSGGAVLDLHIHDVDFVHYMFGPPEWVSSTGATGPSGGVDHIATVYGYPGGPAVSAVGGWMGPPGMPFEMSFAFFLERAVVSFSLAAASGLVVYPADGEPLRPEVPEGDGWGREIAYLVDCLERGDQPEVVTPASARRSVAISIAERESVAKGEPVALEGV